MSHFRLLPVPLEGAGTADVESLPSYVHRSAMLHGAYVGELIQILYTIAERNGALYPFTGRPKYPKPEELVRPGRTTQMIQNLFEMYGLQSLQESTIWLLDNVVGRSPNVIIKGFRWCPECFREWQAQGRPEYFKLIWHMRTIQVCPIHRTPFLQQCEFCGHDQTGYKKAGPIGFCQECGKNLAHRKSGLSPEMITPSWQDIGLDVVKLFDELAKTDRKPFKKDGVQRSLQGIACNIYADREKTKSFFEWLSDHDLFAVYRKRKSVGFKQAQRIAFRLGVSLYDLFSGNAATTTFPLFYEQSSEELPLYLKPVHKTSRDHQAVFESIRALMSGSANPISLKTTALKAGVSVGYIAYRYPALAREIVDKYSKYETQMQLKKIHLAQKIALDFFLAEKYSGEPKSRKQAYRVLREETGLPKHMLRKSIQSAFNALA